MGCGGCRYTQSVHPFCTAQGECTLIDIKEKKKPKRHKQKRNQTPPPSVEISKRKGIEQTSARFIVTQTKRLKGRDFGCPTLGDGRAVQRGTTTGSVQKETFGPM